MRLVRNTSLQGFYITFNTPSGLVDMYLRPKQQVKIPDSYHGGVILDNFVKRRMVKVTNVGADSLTIKPKYKK